MVNSRCLQSTNMGAESTGVDIHGTLMLVLPQQGNHIYLTTRLICNSFLYTLSSYVCILYMYIYTKRSPPPSFHINTCCLLRPPPKRVHRYRRSGRKEEKTMVSAKFGLLLFNILFIAAKYYYYDECRRKQRTGV